MNIKSTILVALIFFALLPPTNTAQVPELPFGWDMGIDSETDTEPVFDLDLDGEASLKFWINNENTYAITLSIEYDIPYEGTFDGPDSVDVDASTNKTFDFTVKGIDVAAFPAGHSDFFAVDATVTAQSGVPSTGGDSKDAEGNLTIPMVVDLTVELMEPSGPMNSGVSTTLSVVVSNAGNAPDSVYKATMTDSCPLLEVNGEDQLEGVPIPANEDLTKILNITSSASHPTKNCVIEISIQSKGDVDAGRTITADSSEVTMKIEESKGSSDDNDNSQSNDDSTEDGEEVVTNNWTPFWPGAVIISLLGAAFNRKE